MIGRIRGRDAFQRLARDGTRIRRSAVWCTWCPDPATSTTSVGFSLPRAVGTAVTRNRLRRRLRAILRQLEPSLSGGMLLIGAKAEATELTFEELRSEITNLLRTATDLTP